MRGSAKLGMLLVVAVCCGGQLWAGGLNLNGVGARANSMGGAFVGQADDLTAVFWNPGGLTRLGEGELSVGVAPVLPTGDYSFSPLGVDTQTKTTVYPGGLLGYGRNVTEKLALAGLVSAPSGTGGRWQEAGLAPLTFGEPFTWESSIALVAVSPAIAYDLTPDLSLGAALILNFGWLDTEVPATFSAGPVQIAEPTTEKMTGFGVGATLGVHYRPSDSLALGLTWRTPSKIEFSGDATNGMAPLIGGAAGIPISDTASVERSITWPHWLGFGVSLQPGSQWTINADVQYNNWGSLSSIEASYDDEAWQNLIAPAAELRLDWSDNLLWRVGVARQLSEAVTLRGGYYYDPAPSPPETTNILMPTADFHGVTAGLDWSRGQVSLQLTVEYLIGQRRDVPATADALMPGSHQYNLFIPQIVFTKRFGR